jgi:hypothetical protein
VIEIWNIAVSPWVLPFTVLLGLVAVFLIISLLGLFDLDSLDFDMDGDGVDGNIDSEGAGGSFMHGMLKAVNATDVPLMMVLSLLSLFMWSFLILWHSSLSWAGIWWGGLLGLVLAFFASSILVRIVMVPCKPIFQAFKKGEDNAEPVVGQLCEIVSTTLTDKYGRVRVPRLKGSPAVVVCRLSEGQPTLEKGTFVLIYKYSKAEKLYLAKKADELTDQSL